MAHLAWVPEAVTAREALGFVTGGCLARGGVGATSAEGSAGFAEDLTGGTAESTPGEIGAGVGGAGLFGGSAGGPYYLPEAIGGEAENGKYSYYRE